jgi:hypothetical protein
MKAILCVGDEHAGSIERCHDGIFDKSSGGEVCLVDVRGQPQGVGRDGRSAEANGRMPSMFVATYVAMNRFARLNPNHTPR